MTGGSESTRDPIAVIDEALNIVSDYGEVLGRETCNRRLRDLPHSPDRIKKAIWVLYASLLNVAAQNLILRHYPKKLSKWILSDEFWNALYGGMAALPQFLSDSECELRAAFMRKELTDSDILRFIEIEQRIHSEAEALLGELKSLEPKKVDPARS
jgi:hypothetical protein